MTTVTGLQALSPCGVVLPLPHSAGLQSSLPILQNNYKFSKVFFWGKLQGHTGDYLIAKGVGETFATPKFFFCEDGVKWAELPPVTQQMMDDVAMLPSVMPLSGDISTRLPLPVPPPVDEEAEPEEPKYVTEIERLAVMVSQIENECALCPAGALMQKADHCIVPASTYTGLAFAAASDLKSYVFMNKPKPADVNASALKASTDFLTSCSEIVPKGSLTLKFDEGTSIVTMRSLLYPGFYAYNVVGMPVHGYCYVGNGLKNVDIAFMLP